MRKTMKGMNEIDKDIIDTHQTKTIYIIMINIVIMSHR